MAKVEFAMANSILQSKIDGRLIPVKLDTQQIAQAKRSGNITPSMKDCILKKLHHELRAQRSLSETHIARIMKRFAEALE